MLLRHQWCHKVLPHLIVKKWGGGNAWRKQANTLTQKQSHKKKYRGWQINKYIDLIYLICAIVAFLQGKCFLFTVFSFYHIWFRFTSEWWMYWRYTLFLMPVADCLPHKNMWPSREELHQMVSQRGASPGQLTGLRAKLLSPFFWTL